MAMILKQSTAFTFRFGPFVDSTDAFTEENALTIAASSVLLSKAGGAFAAKNDATALTGTGASGHYTCPLNATDTNTVGTLRVYANITGALPVFQDFYVVEEAVYDALFGASALGYVANAPVNVAQFGGAALTATGGRPEVNLSHIAGAAVSATTAQLGVNVVNIGNAAAVATGGRPEVNLSHIAGAAVSTTTAQLGVNVVQLSGDGVAADNAEAWFDGTGYTNTSNNIGSTTSVTGNVVGNVQGNVVGSVGSVGTNGITAASLATDAGTEIAQAVMGLAVSGNTAAGTFGEAINNVDLRGSRTVCRGTVGNSTTPSTTQFTPSALTPAGASVDQFKGRIIVFDIATSTAALRGVATDITASTSAALPLLTYSTLPAAPASGDTFSIV